MTMMTTRMIMIVSVINVP